MLLTRPPLPLLGARLACVKPAASVRSEPGSNSQVMILSWSRNAHVVRNKTFDGSWKTGRPTKANRVQTSFCFIAKERERSESSIYCASQVSLAAFLRSKRSSRRPRSPSCNHNVKEPCFRDEKPLSVKQNATRKTVARERRGRGI